MATLNVVSGTQAAPATIGNGTFDQLWGDKQHDCIVENATIAFPPPGNMPKLFGCDRITFRNCTIKGVRANGAHVEGIHLNGCRDITFEDCLFDDNDIFHIFVTQWGGYPAPSNIVCIRTRFGLIGPGGGYYSVLCRENVIPVAGMKFVDCQRKGPGVSPADIPGAAAMTVVAAGAAWPPFSTVTPPEPTPEPPASDLEQRVAALEADVGALKLATIALDTRVDVIEEDMVTLG